MVTVECRGMEFIEFAPGSDFHASSTASSATLTDIDLTDKEWVDYDDEGNVEVSILDVQSQIQRA